MDIDRLRYFRAAADPARMDLFEQLKAEGRPLSTAELARVVPEARGGIQAHLGALAEGGWIDHVGGRGRAAMWRAREVPISWSNDAGGDPAIARALEDLSWIMVQRRINRIRRFDAERQTGEWSREWVEAQIGRDYSLWLTATDLDELDAALAEVFERFKARSVERKQAAGERVPKETELVFVTASAFPVRRGA
ncbi:MAG: winged helix-turn-helix domain-containing protein [Dermatophilaceae bacterium]